MKFNRFPSISIVCYNIKDALHISVRLSGQKAKHLKFNDFLYLHFYTINMVSNKQKRVQCVKAINQIELPPLLKTIKQ